MNDPLPSSAPSRAAARDLRRLRILASVQAGLSYAEIGRAEGLSRERVRQIVAKALSDGGGESKLDHARVQIARLEPALRLAAQGVADGDLAAIDRLLRVLDRLDKYCAVEGAITSEYAGCARKAADQTQHDGRADDCGAQAGSGRRRRAGAAARR